MGDGLGVGDNTRSAVITRGLAEMTRLGVAMGGEPETFAGLAGMGDLIATCISPQSRNRHVGVRARQGSHDRRDHRRDAHGRRRREDRARRDGAAPSSYGVEMPIAREVYGVLYEGRTARDAYRGLIRRGAGAERDPG